MLKFKEGKSYLWLLVLYFSGFGLTFVFCDQYLGNFFLSSLYLPLSLGLLIFFEVRSGVALRFWKAAHPRGTPDYKESIAVQVAGLLLMTALVAHALIRKP